MATQRQVLNSTPTALTGLEADTRYRLTPTGHRRALVATAEDVPATDDPAFSVRPGERIIVRPGMDESVYVWRADDDGTCSVVFEPDPTS